MTKLEQITIKQEELKDFFNAWVKGEEVTEEYHYNGEKKTKVKVKNKRIYFGNNKTLRIDLDKEKGIYYLSIDYFTVEDKIRYSQKKKEEQKPEYNEVF